MSQEEKTEWKPDWKRHGYHYFFNAEDIPESVKSYHCRFPHEHIKIDRNGKIVIVSFVQPPELRDI